LIEKLEKWIAENHIQNVDLDSNYQLNIEDADAISAYDFVIFVDASEEPINDLLFTRVNSSDAKIEFSMHAVSTSYVLDLCKKIYNKTPKTYLLHIKGYEWEFQEPMTAKSLENLEKAFDVVTKIILNTDLAEQFVENPNLSFLNN
jgi:hydrogenase maturation protease